MNEKKQTNKLASIFAKKLFELRTKSGLTQVQLADALGLSRTMISYYESWAKNPTLEAVEKVSDYFEVAPETLISDQKEIVNKKKAGQLSILEKEIEKTLYLSAHKKKILASIVKAFVDSDKEKS